MKQEFLQEKKKKARERNEFKALIPDGDDAVCSLIYGNQKMTNSKYLADIKLIYVKDSKFVHYCVMRIFLVTALTVAVAFAAKRVEFSEVIKSLRIV